MEECENIINIQQLKCLFPLGKLICLMQEMNRRSSRTIIFIFFSATDNVIDTLNEAVQYANDVIVRILLSKSMTSHLFLNSHFSVPLMQNVTQSLLVLKCPITQLKSHYLPYRKILCFLTVQATKEKDLRGTVTRKPTLSKITFSVPSHARNFSLEILPIQAVFRCQKTLLFYSFTSILSSNLFFLLPIFWNLSIFTIPLTQELRSMGLEGVELRLCSDDTIPLIRCNQTCIWCLLEL